MSENVHRKTLKCEAMWNISIWGSTLTAKTTPRHSFVCSFSHKFSLNKIIFTRFHWHVKHFPHAFWNILNKLCVGIIFWKLWKQARFEVSKTGVVRLNLKWVFVRWIYERCLIELRGIFEKFLKISQDFHRQHGNFHIETFSWYFLDYKSQRSLENFQTI